jgi:hypothetical protein
MSETFWTHPSVLRFAQNEDPIQTVMQKARNVVLEAMEAGWKGPPFDPFALARIRNLGTIPQEDVNEARLIQRGGRMEVEYNPLKPRTRIRYSVAHEIAHTLFSDCAEKIRHRKSPQPDRKDDWQLEMLCNLAAAEFLMPIGSFSDFQASKLSIDQIMRWRREFEVSTEAMLLRTLSLARQGHHVFSASTNDGTTYSFDYVLHRDGPLRELYGRHLHRGSLVGNCTAIGYTEKGTDKWPSSFGAVHIECAGIAPYPGSVFPRVVGICRPAHAAPDEALLKEVQGNALNPRGTGPQILAHIVSDAARTWGAGFGKQMAEKFPKAAKRFREKMESSHRLRLGDVFDSDEDDDLIVVQLVAQKGYGESNAPRIRYTALRECLRQVAVLAKDTKASVHMPPIGTGHAGGSWQLIRELIEEELCRHSIPVTVYDLGPRRPPPSKQGTLF